MGRTSTLTKRATQFLVSALVVTAGLTAAAKAVTLDEIKKRGVFHVAMEAAFNPFELVKDGKPVGYDPDILQRVADEWGVKLEISDIRFQGLLTGLEQGKFDMVGSALLMNPARATKFAFTAPIAAGNVILYKRTGDEKVKTVDDLTGLNIGLPLPPSGDENIFRLYNKKLTEQGRGAAKLTPVQAIADRNLALLNGQIDAAEDVNLTFGETQKLFPGKFELVGKVGDPYYIGWVTRPADTELRDEVSKVIRKLRDNGELAKLQKKWFNTTFELPDTGYLPAGAL
ncbi:transporter substrate-binding domain-containing protein [Mesorhizobium sp.]|uniref:transporter substrate-binding domain-containing protein n=1 Tax=Mesorhizobium sp. TaxID=1871066 RepID=UPI0026003A72|nr:transporter substrate-binding domain-containing protein [Mesorhizobium sp.]